MNLLSFNFKMPRKKRILNDEYDENYSASEETGEESNSSFNDFNKDVGDDELVDLINDQEEAAVRDSKI